MIAATPLFRAYAARRIRTLDRQDPAEAQRRVLRHLAWPKVGPALNVSVL